MKSIFLLTDYLDRFESKHNDFPYRSGMDLNKLKIYFKNFNYNPYIVSFPDVKDYLNAMKNSPVLYTSQEDPGYFYKSFIEDVIYGLELNGINVIPCYKYLRANNNKVFMEILREQLNLDKLETSYFGTLEEAMKRVAKLNFPVVIKGAEGANAKRVELANNGKELYRVLKKLSATRNLKEELREIIRSWKYEGYKKISKYRKKIIIQKFIPNLNNDWKVYVFGRKLFVFYRPILNHRKFRASGGGYDNYLYGKEAKIPDGILEFASETYKKLDVPFSSLDIAYDNNKFYLLEFQVLYFGKAGILTKYSNEYFEKSGNGWKVVKNVGDTERIYVESVVEYIER